MPLWLGLVLLGAIVAVALSYSVGVLLVVAGLVLLIVEAVRT